MIINPVRVHYLDGFAQGITSLLIAVLPRFKGCPVNYLAPTSIPASVISTRPGTRGGYVC